ncbi:PTS transporter subunit EIIC [Paenibacillus wynnii]|uniref:PTS transporter subunit EIIC n=1 Tax=Paenibacillus wynnii TaxID=268407 RepID=UPI00278FCF0F|nr:PTS transporter subunit EIIC [Paenibacillus wynnii]MDQ0193783.1 PTS system sucrose-specific IIC component [Paenibacillus wynnii]
MPQGDIRPDQEGQSAKKISSTARELAMRLIELSGGPDNVLEAAHCTTRIRLRLRNSSQADQTALSGIEGVQSVFVLAGQLQIVLGPAIVFKVHRQIVRILRDCKPSRKPDEENPNGLYEPGNTGSIDGPDHGLDHGPDHTLFPSLSKLWKKRTLQIRPASSSSKLESPAKPGVLRRVMDAVIFFSDIVVPIIPLFVAVGLLLGLLGMMEAFGWAPRGSIWFRTLSLLTGSAFQIMAVMFGYHAAKRFGGTPALGAAIGIVMTRPDLVGISGSGGGVLRTVDLMNAPQFGYQGTVIPIILAVLLMTFIEKGLRRIIPASAAIIIIPFLSFAVGGSLAVMVIGPLATELGGSLSSVLEQVFKYGSTVFGLLLGGVYSFIVVTGLHHGIQAVEIGLISNPDIGVNFLLPIWSMANIAQGGAGLAVYARTRDDALRKIALPASITAFLGITEPIAFGVNLKLGYPFLGAAAGGAVGGAYVAFHQVVANSFGLTGIPMIAFIVLPGQMNLIHYLIGFLLAAGSAFVVTWVLGVDKPTIRSADRKYFL